jgi:bifunctional oligoribonuclease and PAP phosphatase NrnA
MSSNQQIKEILAAAQKIVILQADNPDADSLGSALALEALLAEQGKDTYLYCAVDMPDYLKYLEGWSRVNKDLPAQFDASIIVDASTLDLFERLRESSNIPWLAAKPNIVLDHHAETANDISFATVLRNDHEASSTAEVIYLLAKELGWQLPKDALPYILTGILGDTQGLSNQLTRAETYHIVGELVEQGVDRPALEELRRASSKMPEQIFRYKARLIERTELFADGRIAFVSVPHDEIMTYSPLYNPGPLIQSDMLQIAGVLVGIVCKLYDNGRVTGMIRCNPGGGIGSELAAALGGGGHAYAAGFKVQDGRPFNEIKAECIAKATELLDNLNKEHSDEVIQHTNA